VHAGRIADVKAGEWVVIHGAGGVGQALLQYAKACGARVIAVALGAERLALARKLGADEIIDAADGSDVVERVLHITDNGADVVFELVGTTATMRSSIGMLRRRGRVVLVGYTAQDLQIHPVELIVREARVLGSVGSTLQDLYEAVDMVERGLITPFIDYTLPLESFETGLRAVEEGRALGRIVLTMDYAG